MAEGTDPQFTVISLIPALATLIAIVEALSSPQVGSPYALLAFVLASPVLLAWLVWRLLRQT